MPSRLRKHTAGAAGRVEQGKRLVRRRQHIIIGAEQQIDHQPHYFTRRIVVASGRIVGLIEAADQILEQQPHLNIADRFGMQIDLGKATDDQVQHIGVPHALNLGGEIEVAVKDVTHIRREAVDIGLEMLVQIICIALKPAKV